MGLTHFWYRRTELPAELFDAASRDIRHVLQHSGVAIAGFEGTGEPILTSDTVVFNGQAGAACEPFEIHQTEFDRRGRDEVFGFCKTNGLPYDLAVKVSLVVLKHHFGKRFRVMSNDRDAAWSGARELVRAFLKYGDEFQLDPSEPA